MIVVHIESGLGNQMLSYCEYLALKSVNPHQEFFIETIVYEIPECGDYICQWNGYELDKIFGIDTPKNIKTLFRAEEWSQILNEIRATEFWKHNWNYPVTFTKVLNRYGLHLENVRGDFDPNGNIITGTEEERKTFADKIKDSRLGYSLKRIFQKTFEDRYAFRLGTKDKFFTKYDGDIFTGQWLRLNYRGSGREHVDGQIRSTFVFPAFADKRNRETADYLRSVNSVAIHARRGDMSGSLSWCYNYGYFRRAVKLIRQKVDNPEFVFFTNPGGMDWCKANAKSFGLNLKKDKVKFVDWNKESESYRDMQLMGLCKHAIITPSSFGWWGAWLIQNPNKITVSPKIELDTTHHC